MHQTCHIREKLRRGRFHVRYEIGIKRYDWAMSKCNLFTELNAQIEPPTQVRGG